MTPNDAKAPLDEVMLAMDVVDTLRHRERVLARALSAEEQDRELVVRLKEIYAGQGIEVSDLVLERGVRDLRANRFVYTPAPPSVGHLLARVYVSRNRWGKPAGAAFGIVAAAVIGYQVFVRGPELAAIAALPTALDQAYVAVIDAAEEPAVEAQAETLLADGKRAYAGQDYGDMRRAIDELNLLESRLDAQYEVRVHTGRNELSGFFRVPEANPNAHNYYIVVEAVDADGDRVPLPITNEETGRTETVRRWGQRVDEATYDAVRADKSDDGIIQNARLGEKRRGVLTIDFVPGVLPGAVTDW